MNRTKKSRKAHWAPDNSFRAGQGAEEDSHYVAYLAPNGGTRRYVAGDDEGRFYAKVFADTEVPN